MLCLHPYPKAQEKTLVEEKKAQVGEVEMSKWSIGAGFGNPPQLTVRTMAGGEVLKFESQEAFLHFMDTMDRQAAVLGWQPHQKPKCECQYDEEVVK